MSYIKIGKYYGTDPSASTYQFKEVLDVDYLDISSVEYWFEIGSDAGVDYLYQRDGAMGFISASGGFGSLSTGDKSAAASNFCVSKADRDTIYTDAEQEVFWSDFVANSQEARRTRWNKSKSFISYRLALLQSDDLANDTVLLNEKYVYYGIESNATNNIDGLFDYIQGTSTYSGSGFPSKSYYTSSLETGIMNYLNGTYNTTP